MFCIAYSSVICLKISFPGLIGWAREKVNLSAIDYSFFVFYSKGFPPPVCAWDTLLYFIVRLSGLSIELFLYIVSLIFFELCIFPR